MQPRSKSISIELINSSFEALLSWPLLELAKPLAEHDLAQRLYAAPFVLLAHDAQADPVFIYANLCAQDLFEFSWQEFTSLPSRFSAEVMNREERAQLLEKVHKQGYIENYSGIRVSKTGKRFKIQQAIVWDIRNEEGEKLGQAAMFKHWLPLDEC